jgi:hypothetical protein
MGESERERKTGSKAQLVECVGAFSPLFRPPHSQSHTILIRAPPPSPSVLPAMGILLLFLLSSFCSSDAAFRTSSRIHTWRAAILDDGSSSRTDGEVVRDPGLAQRSASHSKSTHPLIS